MRIIKTVALLLCPFILSSSLLANSVKSDDWTVRPSAFKETSEYEDDNTGKTFKDIYGSFVEALNTGNFTGGKQDTKQEASSSSSYTELAEVLSRASDLRTPVPNNKACKGTSAEIDELITYAKSKLASDKTGNYWWGGENPDVPYQTGKTNPNGTIDRNKGVDCSGFIKVCYEHIGIQFDGIRNTGAFLSSLGVKISYADVRPGDVLMFAGNDNPNGTVCHTGIYIGDNKVIHASGDQTHCYKGVTISDVIDNPKGGKKMGGQAVLAVKRVIALTDADNPSSTSTNTSNSTLPTGGSKSNPKVTHLDGYPDGVGVLYSVGGKYTIGINAGHQKTPTDGVKSGTSSIVSGKAEYELTLQVAEKVRKILNDNGYNVLMTRTKHDVTINNPDRGKMFSDAKCDMSIGIHFNGAVAGVTGHGFMGVMASSKKNEAWAKTAMKFCGDLKTVLASKTSKLPSLSDVYGSYTGFDKCTVPYFYFELGYINAVEGGEDNTDSPYVETALYWGHFGNSLVETLGKYFK